MPVLVEDPGIAPVTLTAAEWRALLTGTGPASRGGDASWPTGKPRTQAGEAVGMPWRAQIMVSAAQASVGWVGSAWKAASRWVRSSKPIVGRSRPAADEPADRGGFVVGVVGAGHEQRDAQRVVEGHLSRGPARQGC